MKTNHWLDLPLVDPVTAGGSCLEHKNMTWLKKKGNKAENKILITHRTVGPLSLRSRSPEGSTFCWSFRNYFPSDTWHIPETMYPHQYCCVNLNSHTVSFVLSDVFIWCCLCCVHNQIVNGAKYSLDLDPSLVFCINEKVQFSRISSALFTSCHTVLCVLYCILCEGAFH
jgi:hypothetical protein